MKKLCVNKEACIGCGACVAIDEEHFGFGDDGLSTVISNENIDSNEVNNAISSCPTNAISIVDKNCECEDCDCEDCDCENCECESCNCKEEK